MADEESKVKAFEKKMDTAEQKLKDALVEAAEVQAEKRKAEDPTYVDPYIPNYDDDGANDWLRVLTEIRDEDEKDAFIEEEEELVLANVGETVDIGAANSTLSKDI